MNSFKLLACGRIIFFNRLSAVTPSGELLDKGGTPMGDFCEGDRLDDHQADHGCSLGSSHAAISDNPSFFSWVNPLDRVPRARKGSRGITTHGKNMIRGGCQWLEERFGRKNLTFLTTTLPDEALAVCDPATWSLVVNRFMKSLRYHLEGAGLCPEVVGCIEIQEKRLAQTSGNPPLHLHLLFQGRRPYHHWEIDKGEYQRLWKQACKSVWQLEAEFGQSCRAESVKSSGVSYMSKYLSKGGEVLTKCKPELLPSAWYTISKNVKEIVKGMTLRGGNYLARNLFEQLQESSILKWARDIWSPEHADGSQYLVAWIGQVANRETFWELHNELQKCISVNTEIQNKEYKFKFAG